MRVLPLITTISGIEDTAGVPGKLVADKNGCGDRSNLGDPLLHHLLVRIPDILPRNHLSKSIPAWNGKPIQFIRYQHLEPILLMKLSLRKE